MHDTRGGGHVFERPIALVSIQSMSGASGSLSVGERATVNQEDVQPAVVVVVEEQASGPHGFDNMLVRAGAVGVPEVESGLLRDVFEKNGRRVGGGLGAS